MKKLSTFILFIIVSLLVCTSVNAFEYDTPNQECDDGYYSFFSLTNFDYSDSDGDSTEVETVCTSTYIYGRCNLWVSLSKIADLESGGYYYILLVDAMTWAKGKYNSTTWFSTKEINYTITCGDSNMEFYEAVSIGNESYLNDDFVMYGNQEDQSISFNKNASTTSVLRYNSGPFTQTQLNRVTHSNQKLGLGENQYRRADIKYSFSGYSSDRTLPCAGTFHQCTAIILKSSLPTAEVTVTMSASFFKDKKYGSNNTEESQIHTLTRRVY